MVAALYGHDRKARKHEAHRVVIVLGSRSILAVVKPVACAGMQL